jgi:hypothetical protein
VRSADLHGYETDDADQIKRADRVDLASWGCRSMRRRRALAGDGRVFVWVLSIAEDGANDGET